MTQNDETERTDGRQHDELPDDRPLPGNKTYPADERPQPGIGKDDPVSDTGTTNQHDTASDDTASGDTASGDQADPSDAEPVYNDRSQLDFDPDEGFYTGTAVTGDTEIPGEHERVDDVPIPDADDADGDPTGDSGRGPTGGSDDDPA